MPTRTDRWSAGGLSRVRAVLSSLGPTSAIVALTVLALTIRLIALGARSAHWDEARVGYWVLRSLATGDWQYRPILHGPFLQHVTRMLFPVVGATDTTMRLPTAFVGGLLPLVALCFRTRLDDAETVALAALLAVDPLLLYFSRFMRSDVPLVAFAFLTVGALVRLWDTDRVRWLYVAVLAFALALTTKENALLYPLSWLGAGTLVAGWRLWRTAPADRRATATDWGRTLRHRTRPWLGHLVVATALALVVLVWFYAPRSGSPDGVGLWTALANPSQLPAVVEAATLGSLDRLGAVWLSGSVRNHSYLLYLGYYLLVLAIGAGPLAVLAVLGVRADSGGASGEGRGRPLVAFCALWGLSGVVGYPYATDILAPWLTVHVVVPLAVPAAVGLVWTLRRLGAVAGASAGLSMRGTLLAALLVVGSLQIAVVAGVTSYTNPPGELNVVAQASQPGSDLHPTVERMTAATAGGGDDVDVLYVGDLAVEPESANDAYPAASNWFGRLPLPWYTEARGMDTASARDPAAIGREPPPVVVTTPDSREAVAAHLSDYTPTTVSVYLRPEPRRVSILGVERTLPGRSVVVFIRADAR